MNLDRARFLMENRGGPHNLLPVIPQYKAGNPHPNGINAEEFAAMTNLVFEVNDRLERTLISMKQEPFHIDLIGVLAMVTDMEDEIRWHKIRMIQGQQHTSTGTIAVSEIPNSILTYVSGFFKEKNI